MKSTTAAPLSYIGRFAPSPTGPLHIGSLIAAVGSYLEARRHAGQWLLRIEDVDAPRTVAGAGDTILHQLETFGFEWDGKTVWQSQRLTLYQEALDRLIQARLAYPCACTRKEIADSTLARDGSRRYPGTCRNGLTQGRIGRAWRVRTEDSKLYWQDTIQGEQSENVWEDVGDFVLLRADGQFAYQLAVVVDDAQQGVTHIVRGSDLLDSTARQIQLQHLLGYPTPQYAHLPVATNAAGEKLSKQTLAAPLDVAHPADGLVDALSFLGQQPPDVLRGASTQDVWRWAHEYWDMNRVPKQRGIIIET